MPKKLALVFLSLIFFSPVTLFAATTPSLLEPEQNIVTTDTSPKLYWSYSGQCPSSGNCFLVEVSKSENFSSTEKSTYTNNTSYTPSLSEGTYYWRVKAKDETNSWSDYSPIRSFRIGAATSVQPSASIQPTSTPQPSPSPSATLNPAPAEKQSFTVSASKNNFDSTQQLSIQVSLNNFSPNTTYYLKPSFYQNGSTNYFGLTEINGNWTKNSITATSQSKITTDNVGAWSGNLQIKADVDDSGFKGAGNYNLKVGRYSESGSGPSWSNSVEVIIQHTEVVEEETKAQGGESTIVPTTSPVSVLAATSSPTYAVDLENEATSEAHRHYQIATISAEENDQSLEGPLILGEQKINWWFIAASLPFFVLSGLYIVRIRKKMYYA